MELRDAARKLLVVDREKFRIRLYDRGRDDIEFDRVAEFPIAVGAEGFTTPRGVYTIHSKVKDPAWHVPNSSWAREAGYPPGAVVPGGAKDNPIKERWLGVTEPEEGIGIHGTGAKETMGTRASHGCIRMLPKDVVKLYEQVPIGTPVVII